MPQENRFDPFTDSELETLIRGLDEYLERIHDTEGENLKKELQSVLDRRE